MTLRFIPDPWTAAEAVLEQFDAAALAGHHWPTNYRGPLRNGRYVAVGAVGPMASSCWSSRVAAALLIGPGRA